jgi:uncharacterized protein YdhG (YjbR/CyaY superfamily)
MPGPSDVDAYLASLPADRRAPMDELRRVIKEAAPDADEVLAYRMPAFRSHRGQFLVSYDAYKRHYSLFPASDAVVRTLGAQIEPYLAGRGTIRFPAERPIPVELVRRIVEIRVAENAARGRG